MAEGRRKKRRRRERDLPTKGAAKMQLVSQGVGFWTDHNGEWCVRIAGEFKRGDRVRIMANAGHVANCVLGDPVPNTRFQWRNAEGDRIDGQLFRRWTGKDTGKMGGERGEKTAEGMMSFTDAEWNDPAKKAKLIADFKGRTASAAARAKGGYQCES